MFPGVDGVFGANAESVSRRSSYRLAVDPESSGFRLLDPKASQPRSCPVLDV